MKIAARIYEKHGLRNCVGIVDGTTVIFIQKPAVDGGDFFFDRYTSPCLLYALRKCILCCIVYLFEYIHWKALFKWGRISHYLSSLHGYWAYFLIAMLFYFYRKDRYSINLQLICDDERRIRYFVIGFPGSMYDGDVLSQCPMYQSPEELFSFFMRIMWHSGRAINSRHSHN